MRADLTMIWFVVRAGSFRYDGKVCEGKFGAIENDYLLYEHENKKKKVKWTKDQEIEAVKSGM